MTYNDLTKYFDISFIKEAPVGYYIKLKRYQVLLIVT